MCSTLLTKQVSQVGVEVGDPACYDYHDTVTVA
jgi:hypothetical protein